MPLSAKKMIKLLKKNGFVEIKGGRGSHRRFKNHQTGKVTEVPFHSRDLKKGTEQAILKQAGLK